MLRYPICVILWLALQASLLAKTEIMPLSEVMPGMEGIWKTAVQGTKVESFRLRVLGISKNFVGPKRDVIICEALDDDQILNGPVAGMSGSPVYIDGKLVGAYAYGFSLPKEQAIIGVTPIEHMLELMDKPQVVSTSGMEKRSSMKDILGAGILSALKPTPTPLFVSGIPQDMIDAFAEHIEHPSLYAVAAPLGHSDIPAEKWAEEHFEPGMPVAAVLMDGDFNMAAVGTITWREGNQILGFGHPFSQLGETNIPMAGAEIITVVRTLVRSFKLSNIGPVIGSIKEDRLTAISGTLGDFAPVTNVSYHLRGASGIEEHYKGRLFRNKSYGPFIVALGLWRTLQSSIQKESEQTFFVKRTYQIKGMEPLVLEQAYDNLILSVLDVWSELGELYDNRFGMPAFESIDFEIKCEPAIRHSEIDAYRMLSGEPHPGTSLDLAIDLRQYQGDVLQHTISIPIPSNASGENYRVLICDAAYADRMDLGYYRSDDDSFADMVNRMRKKKNNDAVYIRLVAPAKGVFISGEELTDLPPTVYQSLTSPRSKEHMRLTYNDTIWEMSIKVPGLFRGVESFNISIP